MPSLCKERGNRWRGIVKIAGKVVETKLFGQGPNKGEQWMAARQWEMGRRKELLEPSPKASEALLTPAERPYKTECVFAQLDDTPSPNHRPGEAFKYRQHFLGRLCKRAGVLKFDFHAIRHLTAVILFKAGYKVGFIQKVLRHTHPSTTETYLRSHGIDLEELRAGLETFDGRGPAGDVLPAQKLNPQGCNLEGSGYTTGVHTRLN